MKNKEFKLAINVVLIFISVLLIYGIFSPWITVATIFNVSGTSSVYGLFVFISAFMFIVYGLTGLIQNSVLGEYQNLIRKITLIVSTFTLLNLMYLIYRYLDAIKEFNKITDKASTSTEGLGELGQSLDNLFENITNALKPTIGLGFYIILIGIVVGLILSIPVIDNKNVKLDTFGKYYALVITILILLSSSFIFLQTRSVSTSSEIARETPEPSLSISNEGGQADFISVPEIKDLLVSEKKITLVWNPIFDSEQNIVEKYEWRMKTSFQDWGAFEPVLCDFSSKEITKNMKPSDTLSCDWDFSEVPEKDLVAFGTNRDYGLNFQLRGIDESGSGTWSSKASVLYLYEYPEFLGM